MNNDEKEALRKDLNRASEDYTALVSSCVDWNDRQLLENWCIELRKMAESEVDSNGGVILDSCSNPLVSKLIGLCYLIDKWADQKYPMNNKCNATCGR